MNTMNDLFWLIRSFLQKVVTLSTQAFFLASLLGRQHIHENPDPEHKKIIAHQYGEYYFPIFTLLQFILYMGLLKVRNLFKMHLTQFNLHITRMILKMINEMRNYTRILFNKTKEFSNASDFLN